MDIQDYIQEAISMVDSWDLPEKDFAQAVNDQARLMCGLNLELSGDLPPASPYAALHF